MATNGERIAALEEQVDALTDLVRDGFTVFAQRLGIEPEEMARQLSETTGEWGRRCSKALHTIDEVKKQL